MYENLKPRLRHYTANRGVRIAILYMRHLCIRDTSRASILVAFNQFFILDGAKIRKFIETTKLFLRKNYLFL
nr:MAG TPA: hypothetical protein [Bacteriophage sp.]